jgi:hypothetical protein
MLTGQMPLILFKLKRVLYWGDADQRMDFTTMDDTAAFTADSLDDGAGCALSVSSNLASTALPMPYLRQRDPSVPT